MAAFCTNIGSNPLLVQGAGGNVSWKDQDILWIKASGTWLAHAQNKPIFVPVDLAALNKEISLGNFFVKPKLTIDTLLRPSIETLLHALLPHPIVVHIHAIEALSFLVLKDQQVIFEKIQQLMGEPLLLIPYHQPGSSLAIAVYNSLQGTKSKVRCLLLKNHGVILGASSIPEMKGLIDALQNACQTISHSIDFSLSKNEFIENFSGYSPAEDPQIHSLACNPDLYRRLSHEWVLFPDHAVFLGSHAFLFPSSKEFKIYLRRHKAPQLIFIENQGVYYQDTFTAAQKVQLKCYLDLLRIIDPSAQLNPLSQSEINHLLKRDDEKFRLVQK